MNRGFELARLKAGIDAKWKAHEETLLGSLNQGMITWRRRKDGEFVIKLKPEL